MENNSKREPNLLSDLGFASALSFGILLLAPFPSSHNADLSPATNDLLSLARYLVPVSACLAFGFVAGAAASRKNRSTARIAFTALLAGLFALGMSR